MGQRVGVVGAGAMGTLLGGALEAAGHDVVLVDVDPDIIERITSDGVTVEPGEGRTTTTLRAVSPGLRAVSPGTPMESPCDVLVVFVKGMHTESAITDTGAAQFWGADTTVVTLQNGWGLPDRLCAAGVQPAQLVAGVCNHSATLLAPGRVLHAGAGPTIVGPWADAAHERAAEVAGLLQSIGWPSHVSDDIRTDIWRKLVLNSASLPISALTGLPCRGLVESDDTRDLMVAVMRETAAVGVALGFPIDADERISFVLDVLHNAGEGKPSMLQDVLAGRASEIDTITGAIVAAARDVGVDVPVNESLLRLVKGTEYARTRRGEPVGVS